MLTMPATFHVARDPLAGDRLMRFYRWLRATPD